MSLIDLPLEARPRERLLRLGPDPLSSIELIAILLGSGTKQRTVLELSADLLAHFGSLEALSQATVPELSAVKGIGSTKALQLQAAFALFHRIKSTPTAPLIDTPQAAFDLLAPILQNEKTEVLYVLLRDVRKRLIHQEEIGRGLLNQIMVHPREVFCSAIRHRAHTLLIAHNHPSGDPTPSTSDIEATQHLAAAGKLIGIPLVDHIILGRNRFFSFSQKNLIMISGDSY